MWNSIRVVSLVVAVQGLGIAPVLKEKITFYENSLMAAAVASREPSCNKRNIVRNEMLRFKCRANCVAWR